MKTIEIKTPLLNIEDIIKKGHTVIAVDRNVRDIFMFQNPVYRVITAEGWEDVYKIKDILVIQGLWGYDCDKVPFVGEHELEALEEEAWRIIHNPEIIWADKEIKTNELLDKYIEEVVLIELGN